MNGVSVFTNKEFGDVSVISVDGKPYFDGIDVCKILGYKNKNDAINRHCKKDTIVFHDSVLVTGKKVNGDNIKKTIKRAFISEGNLYRLIIKSKNKEAEKFEKWVMDEVLPTIRKEGGYYHDHRFVEKLIRICNSQHRDIERLICDRKANEPYINIGKTVSSSDNAISIGGFAKVLKNIGVDIGRNRLFAWFRANGYIMKQGMENQPKQVYIDRGLFVTRQYSINTSDGIRISVTPYITGKGQVYFIDKIREEFCYGRFYKNV
ncbi:phage antirepressor [Romboutsia hominis]|uniref:Prophage antirepressor n=1 Tax=Romboutsia hominis TaxID=1507512 RepID=A0A2P2BSN5_9FIRM|nr:phage antirepressor KilAC domain-containing protein [Romboutsia hominis]CEI73350.1 Prophage antirepressor [Romboutsia hominis]